MIKEEKKTEYIKKIISFFLDERNEEIGIIAAGKILDFFNQELGKEYYQQGIKDAKKLLKEKMEDMEMDLDAISENK